ncbi:MAG: 6-phosphofructokinase [Deltaproteobacteria bacterium CG11_big_fil_rev_8_21_14_0_20_49_13]|nr:MAG: 6-phosphofructokinase [Deltaproteobacteria bacterium CG11_big_fil_rev_8_21_14_0_20_49_13]
MNKRVGILTGGGDCPGLNAVIRAVVWRATQFGDRVIGLKNGWAGLLNADTMPLDRKMVGGILYRGGTILGTSRTNIFKEESIAETAIKNFKKIGLDALVAVGGEDTLGAAYKLAQRGINVVGVPKTIDNDLPGTDFTFGFDTAISIATEAIDRLHTTAESHNRVLVVEVMGRHAGWIATYSGLAGGADIILVPEHPFRVEDVCEAIRRRHDAGKFFSIVCIAEGAQMVTRKGKESVLSSKGKDAFGHVRLGGIGAVLAERIEEITGYETRVTVLGHIQRGGTPTAHDRVLATRYGVEAMDCVHEQDFGVMVALQGSKIVRIPLKTVAKKIKTIDKDLYDLTKVFQY